MLVEMRTGDVHGVDLTMCDAYRWAKEVAPIDLRDESYVQLSDVFDIFVFDFATAAVEQQVEQLDVAIAKDGVASAIVIWFDLVLDEEIVVSSRRSSRARRRSPSARGSSTSSRTRRR